MLTAVQRAGIIGYADQADLDKTTATDEDIWYRFLSSLYADDKTLKDLKLTPAQRPEIMACLRRAPSVAPRSFSRRGERPIRTAPTAVVHPD